MALIMREGLKNKKFRRIIGATDYTIKPTNMNSEPRVLHTHHPMLAPESSYHYDGCIGGKTGYTSEAGLCLASFAEIYDREYILVTAGASGNTGSPLHVEDAVTIYNRLGKAIEAQMTGSDGSES